MKISDKYMHKFCMKYHLRITDETLSLYSESSMESVSVPVEILCRSELFIYKYSCSTLWIEALERIVILCSYLTFCLFYVDGAV